MKPKRIILIRHGESIGNVDKTAYKDTPDYAIGLTTRGKRQSMAAGKKLKEIIGNETVQFYYSPFFRVRQTFLGIVKGMGLKACLTHEDPRLREQEWGQTFERPVGEQIIDQEKNRSRYGTFYYRFRDGESCADVFDRISDFLNTLHRDFEKEHFSENVIIVTHGMAMRLFLMRWFHHEVEEFESWGNPGNCEFFTLTLGPDGKYEQDRPLRKRPTRHPHQFQWDEEVQSFEDLIKDCPENDYDSLCHGKKIVRSISAIPKGKVQPIRGVYRSIDLEDSIQVLLNKSGYRRDEIDYFMIKDLPDEY